MGLDNIVEAIDRARDFGDVTWILSPWTVSAKLFYTLMRAVCHASEGFCF
jgi:hypothetical protein